MTSTKRGIYIGFDSREVSGYAVARLSIKDHRTQPIPVHGLVLAEMQASGLYRRPIEIRKNDTGRNVMWDTISGAAQSTEHANSRFFVPLLAQTGWAMFMDSDVLVRANLARVFDELDRRYAVYCVKHTQVQPEGVKMDGQPQVQYQRKNWSSVMVFNVDHPANRTLTPEMVNSIPGRDMHRFCWLDDDQIGTLDPSYNFLVGHSDPKIDPKIVHFTDGLPDMAGYENQPYADEWRSVLHRWAK
jgi:hypothetical protein